MNTARILIIEDEIVIAMDIEKKLKKLGHQVVSICATGEEAVQKALNLHPDLILMDIRLQGEMDGIETARKIRSHEGIAIIYLTALSDEKTLQRAMITESYAYIQKPITSRELHIAVEIAIYRQTVQQEISLQLQRMTAMRMVDEAILSNHDPHSAMRVALHQITFQLEVDAAAVLLLNPSSRTLEFFEGYGFRTDSYQKTCLLLGGDLVGRASQDCHIEQVLDLSTDQTKSRPVRLDDEGFIGYMVVPLICKGQLKGILEVFCRSPLETNPEWLDFLNGLANQAAVAIDNASMLEELRSANLEMLQSYNATIQGWSAALEMRDLETEGHSQRVTKMTLEIACAMGIQGTELEHIRRGALLHDIGKMGIPDHILHKPGELTPEEWAIMRKHPSYAQDLLSFAPFLKPALDIPFFHHERWDGNGYPNGLKGESIPLSARIFAVVDVWDALLSDRPYRKAWPKEKVTEYLRQKSGSQFDPQVVEVFLKLII